MANEGWKCLSVTSVHILPVKVREGNKLADASVVLNDQLYLRGLSVRDGDNGLYVGYPSDGEGWRSQFFPMTRALREHVENCVLEKYHQSAEYGGWVVKYGIGDETVGEVRVMATDREGAIGAAIKAVGGLLESGDYEVLSAEEGM